MMPNPNIALTLGLFLALTAQVSAGNDTGDAELCRQAAAAAAMDSGVPYDVLLSLSIVETGRGQEPWPWTVNIGGDGHWPDTAEDAAALVQDALDAGLTNVDLGCFQLNLYWHAGAFQSIEDMLDPTRNAAYAADFLAEKFAATGDWSLAAAAYHSATPEYAEIYQGKFDTIWAGLDGEVPPAARPTSLPENRFPLLLAGKAGSPGSIVPSTAAGLRLIGGP